MLQWKPRFASALALLALSAVALVGGWLDGLEIFGWWW